MPNLAHPLQQPQLTVNKYNTVCVLKNQKTFYILQLRVMYIYAYSLGNKYQIIQNSCATDLKAHLIHVMRVTLFSIATQRRRRHHSVCMHNLLFSRKKSLNGPSQPFSKWLLLLAVYLPKYTIHYYSMDYSYPVRILWKINQIFKVDL